ncbi:hypothetical protein Droror1_Dr00006134 [Drosera rotundifolia]
MEMTAGRPEVRGERRKRTTSGDQDGEKERGWVAAAAKGGGERSKDGLGVWRMSRERKQSCSLPLKIPISPPLLSPFVILLSTLSQPKPPPLAALSLRRWRKNAFANPHSRVRLFLLDWCKNSGFDFGF